MSLSKIIVRLIISCLACMAVYVLVKKTELKVTALSRIDPLPKTRSLVEEERFAEANDYLEFFMEYDYVRENPDAQSHFEKASKACFPSGYSHVIKFSRHCDSYTHYPFITFIDTVIG